MRSTQSESEYATPTPPADIPWVCQGSHGCGMWAIWVCRGSAWVNHNLVLAMPWVWHGRATGMPWMCALDAKCVPRIFARRVRYVCARHVPYVRHLWHGCADVHSMGDAMGMPPVHRGKSSDMGHGYADDLLGMCWVSAAVLPLMRHACYVCAMCMPCWRHVHVKGMPRGPSWALHGYMPWGHRRGTAEYARGPRFGMPWDHHRPAAEILRMCCGWSADVLRIGYGCATQTLRITVACAKYEPHLCNARAMDPPCECHDPAAGMPWVLCCATATPRASY